MQFKITKATHHKSSTEADIFLEPLEVTHQVRRDTFLEAPENQKNEACGKVITFEVGDRVWLLTSQFRPIRPLK
jgi:hypothetical protein